MRTVILSLCVFALMAAVALAVDPAELALDAVPNDVAPNTATIQCVNLPAPGPCPYPYIIFSGFDNNFRKNCCTAPVPQPINRNCVNLPAAGPCPIPYPVFAGFDNNGKKVSKRCMSTWAILTHLMLITRQNCCNF